MRATVLYVIGFALLFWVVASVIGFLLPWTGVIEVVGLVGGGLYGWRQAEQRGRANEAEVDQPRSWFQLSGVLTVHVLGALTWFAFLGFSADIGTDRQFKAATAFGLVTWLAAAAVIVRLWRSAESPLRTWSIPFVWWLPSFLLMIAIVYGR
jgi:hypothetical protein